MNGFPSALTEAEAINAEDRAAAELELRSIWGEDSVYFGNLRAITEHIDALPADARARIEGGLTEDGRQVLNSAGELQRLASEASKSPPALVEAAKQFNGDELQAIAAMQRDRNSAYYRGPESERIQMMARALYAQGGAREESSTWATRGPKVIEGGTFGKPPPHRG